LYKDNTRIEPNTRKIPISIEEVKYSIRGVMIARYFVNEFGEGLVHSKNNYKFFN